MTKTKITISVIFLFVLVAANAWQHWLKPAPPAPNLNMITLAGEPIDLQALQGNPVLVTFWASSCGLCLMEIDDLIALHNKYQAQGYTTLAIALSYDSLPAVQAITQKKRLPYKVIFDKKGSYAKAFGGVRMTPTHFLISPDGHIIWEGIGPINRTELGVLIGSLVS